MTGFDALLLTQAPDKQTQNNKVGWKDEKKGRKEEIYLDRWQNISAGIPAKKAANEHHLKIKFQFQPHPLRSQTTNDSADVKKSSLQNTVTKINKKNYWKRSQSYLGSRVNIGQKSRDLPQLKC